MTLNIFLLEFTLINIKKENSFRIFFKRLLFQKN